VESDPNEPDEDFTLIGGPCCGDTITPDKSDTHIRRGECLDREVPLHLKGEYTEALYTRMPDNKWVYIGRYRWDGDKTYFSES
jgi:hypothetical protein